MTGRDGGDVKMLGLDNIEDEASIKQEIGAVFDETYFVDGWRVREVESALRTFYRNWNGELYDRYIQSFKLPSDKRVKELSRGMRIKLMLAVAMSHEAKLLILDEPTSGLDPVARDELLGILEAYVEDGQKSVLFSTHITTDLEKIAGYVTLIHDGRIFYAGTKDDLLGGFYLVKGDLDDLTSPLDGKIMGLSKTRTGFSGLIRASEKSLLPNEVFTEQPTIDDILVAISKGV
jgi:ABC-2 type transport system ATP-binding protein